MEPVVCYFFGLAASWTELREPGSEFGGSAEL